MAGLQIFGISTLHNSINQMIFTGKVDAGVALRTGAYAGFTGAIGAQIGAQYDLNFSKGASAWISNGGQWLFNSVNTSSGIPVRCNEDLVETGAQTVVTPSFETRYRLCF